MPEENLILTELEAEVETELTMARSSHPEEEIGEDPAGWAFDPTDVEREEVGLRSILGAVIALESDSRLSVPTSPLGDKPAD